MKFRYQVLESATGKTLVGDIEAENTERARLILLQQGYDVLLIEELHQRVSVGKQFGERLIGLVSLRDKMLFVKHLALMIKSGLTLDESLELLYGQSKSSLRKILKQVLANVRKGNLLSDSLGRYPANFNGFFINMLRIGEQSGGLEESLNNLSTKLKKDHDLKSKVRAAMLYPMITIGALLGLGFTISIFVLPKLLGFFESLNVAIPVTTQIFIAAAAFFNEHWLVSGLGFASLIVVFVIMNKLSSTKSIIHWIVLHLPVSKTFSQRSNVANFCRSMNLLLESGITVDHSLEILADAINNNYYKRAARDIIERVRKGDSLASSLEEHAKYFPPIVSKMIHVGEVSGNMAETFHYLADFYEDQLDDLSKNLSTILEPILLVIVGLLVGFVAMAIVSPIYNLTGGIR